jgi:hypothetical protein
MTLYGLKYVLPTTKLQGKKPGTARHKWMLQKRCIHCINLARVQWHVLVSTAINLPTEFTDQLSNHQLPRNAMHQGVVGG